DADEVNSVADGAEIPRESESSAAGGHRNGAARCAIARPNLAAGRVAVVRGEVESAVHVLQRTFIAGPTHHLQIAKVGKGRCAARRSVARPELVANCVVAADE